LLIGTANAGRLSDGKSGKKSVEIYCDYAGLVLALGKKAGLTKISSNLMLFNPVSTLVQLVTIY
jgi:hypothetical protein